MHSNSAETFMWSRGRGVGVYGLLEELAITAGDVVGEPFDEVDPDVFGKGFGKVRKPMSGDDSVILAEFPVLGGIADEIHEELSKVLWDPWLLLNPRDGVLVVVVEVFGGMTNGLNVMGAASGGVLHFQDIPIRPARLKKGYDIIYGMVAASGHGDEFNHTVLVTVVHAGAGK